MDPIDVIKSILHQLNDKQKDELRKLLGTVGKPCDRLGHDYKPAGKSGNFWEQQKTVLFCKRCGDTKEV